MNIEFKKIETQEEYIDLVEKLSYLVDKEITEYEMLLQKNVFEVVNAMPKIISLVNVIGYLRGQGGAFLNFRPKVSEHQESLYKNEDAFEARLYKLVEKISESEETRNHYESTLKEYFIKNRLSTKKS